MTHHDRSVLLPVAATARERTLAAWRIITMPPRMYR